MKTNKLKSFAQNAFVFLMTAMGGLSAHADDTEIFFGGAVSSSVQPNILFILDTSGSMDNYDGTSETRIDRMKTALRSLINSMNNVNVGLMRFNAPGGPILYPITDIDQSLSEAAGSSSYSGTVEARPASSTDDGEESSSGSMTIDNNEATLTTLNIAGAGTTVPLSLQIATGLDDAEQSAWWGTMYRTGSRLYMPRDDWYGGPERRQRQYIGFRFQNLTIPPGSTIESASIDFKIKQVEFTQDVSMDIYAEANDSGSFGSSNWNISNRTSTSSVITWNLSGGSPSVGDTLSTTDFKAVIQELVNSGSWSSGNAATIIFKHESGSGNRIVSTFEDGASKSATLNIAYTGAGGGAPDNQTVGIRFTDVGIPQGATITGAEIDFTASTSSSGTAVFTIAGEDADHADTYETGSNNISGRSYTSNTSTWTPADWTSAGSTFTTNSLTSVVQEIVNRSGWCGGNSMAFKFTGNAFNTGSRVFDTYDKSASTAPKLRVTYDPDTIPASGGCMSTELNIQISEDADDAEQDGRSMNLTSSDLDMPDYLSGVRFQNIPVPQGSKVLSAYLEFTADNSSSDTLNLDIEGHDSDNSSQFTSSNYNMSSRTRTSANVNWNSVESWSTDNSYRSPDISAIVQEIVDRSGWDTGNAMSFIISDNGGGGYRGAYTFDENPASSARLIIKAVGVDASIAEETTRDALLDLVDDFRAAGPTPIVDTLYEAALYFQGDDMYFGNSRGWDGWSSNRRYFRVSHEDSYTGGTLVTPGSCSTSNYDSSNCEDEVITGSPTYISPITDACQSNHIVLLTDGSPTVNESASLVRSMTGDSSCETSGDGACAQELVEHLNTNDMAGSLANDQTITTHTIGFNFNTSYLADVASHGDGQYLLADSADELLAQFNKILREILQTDTTFVSPGVTVNSFNKLTHRNEIYYALFRPEEDPKWPGNLKRYKLQTDGTIVDDNDQDAIDEATGFFNDSATSIWSSSADGNDVTAGGAAKELPNYATRNIYTYYSSSTSDTLSNSTNAFSYANRTNVTKAMMGIDSESNTYHQNLIDWARGKDVLDADGDGITNENRDQLSDPLHSVPHLVTYGGTDANPDITIFYGDNEGFIHAIDADDGSEVFSFIPEELLDNLDTLYQNSGENLHLYGMDGPVTSWVYDANADATIDSSTDHVYVYFGMRRGGSSYYALDATDRDNPKILWTITGGSGDYSELAQSWSKPVKTKVTIGNNEKDVLIFAAGYDEDQDDVSVRTIDDEGRGIFIVDAATGSLLWSAGQSGSDDLTLSDMQYSIPSDVRVIDVNNDGFADQFYVGDMGGQVWRFDIHNGENTGNLVTGGVIADMGGTTTADNRRFYHEPDLSVLVEGGQRKLAVAIGSGYQAHPLNKTNEDRFYLFKLDDVTSAPADGSDAGSDPDYETITESDLYNASNNLIQEGSDSQKEIAISELAAAQGWYIEMENEGEKVLSRALTRSGELLFTTYEPNATSTTTCVAAAGTPRLYQVNIADATPTGNRNLGEEDTDSHDRASILQTIGLPADPVILRITGNICNDCDGVIDPDDPDDPDRTGSVFGETQDIVCVGTECEQFGGAGSILKTYWYSE